MEIAKHIVGLDHIDYLTILLSRLSGDPKTPSGFSFTTQSQDCRAWKRRIQK